MAPLSLGGAAPAGSLWLLLFAEIQGGSKTKQAAPASNAPHGREIPTVARRYEGKRVMERLRLLKQKYFQSSAASVGVKKIKQRKHRALVTVLAA